MYYLHKLPNTDKLIHIHVKQDGIRLKNIEGTMLNVLDEPRTIRQTEQLFNAKFRIVTNDDGSKTKVFM